jgi:hypothetical protein
MARIIQDESEIIEYIPEDDRGDKDPLVIKMKFCPYGRVKYYSEMIGRRSKGVRNTTKIAEIQREVQKQQFTDNIVGVENFFVIKGGKQTPVTDASEFYEKAPADLIYEIIGAMEDNSKLTEGQKVNFPQPSDGLSE